MKDHDPVCRCDKGSNKTLAGKCIGGCSLTKHSL